MLGRVSLSTQGEFQYSGTDLWNKEETERILIFYSTLIIDNIINVSDNPAKSLYAREKGCKSLLNGCHALREHFNIIQT